MNVTTLSSLPYVYPTTSELRIPGPSADHYDTVRDIRFYALGVIIPCGLIANCIAITVFVKSKLFQTVPGLYFSCLAIADNTVLIGELLLWLNTRTSHGTKMFNFMNSHDFFCKVIYAIRYSGRAWSSWITVSITIERFLCVTFPFKAHRWSSRAKTKFVIITMFILAMSIALYPLWPTNYIGVGIYKNEPLCMMLWETKNKYDIWNWVFVAVGELFIPSAMVTVFTAVIIFQLVKAYSRRVRMMSTRASSHSMSLLSTSIKTVPGSSRNRYDLQPTVTLVVVAVSFIIIRLPYTVMFYINNHKENLDDAWTRFYIYAAYSFALALSVINYAINFFLYCLSGNQYRKHVWYCVRCVRQGNPMHVNLSMASNIDQTTHGSRGRTEVRETDTEMSKTWRGSPWSNIHHNKKDPKAYVV